MTPTRATWFLTHRCNLACSYCATILPDQLTDELGERDTLRVADAIVAVAPEVVILTGGEATMHPHAQAVIDLFNDAGQEFVLITNATRPLRLTGITNISCSVDTIPVPKLRRADAASDEAYKTSWGFQFLKDAHERGMNATASIVLGRDNAADVPALIEALDRLGIASMLGVLHESRHDPRYRWRIRATGSVEHRLSTRQAVELSERLCELHDRGVRILNDRAYLAGIALHGATLDWHCEEPSDLVVDSDGTVLTCSDWWGPRCKALDVREALIDTGTFLRAWRAAHSSDNRACPGCFWNCSFQAESASSSLTVDAHGG